MTGVSCGVGIASEIARKILAMNGIMAGLFCVQDSNNDGKLDQFEFYEGMLSAGIDLSVEDATRLAVILDPNEDGLIEYAEFKHGLQYRHIQRSDSESNLAAAQLHSLPSMSPHKVQTGAPHGRRH